jgi:hypothetical protein
VSSISRQSPRVLFLDDDPDRAVVFLAAYPDAFWVQTAEECLARLSEPWDEVHLDHDLGGEAFVDHERDDCGMAVVRWLCDRPRPHLKDTRFVVHTHNPDAACLMALQLQLAGYGVEVCPFGCIVDPPAPPGRLQSLVARVLRWLRGGNVPRVAPNAAEREPGEVVGEPQSPAGRTTEVDPLRT